MGITTFYLKDAQSLNFALPVEWIGEVAGGKIRERPRRGVQLLIQNKCILVRSNLAELAAALR